MTPPPSSSSTPPVAAYATPAFPRATGATLVLRQTLAILLDAYRELQSRRLFWISLAISAVVCLAFAAIGFSPTGFSVLGKHFNNGVINTQFIPAADLYKGLFIGFGVQWWLGFFGIILALVSTAPMFPDFVSSGSVDLYLARPLGRLRLFLTKYLAGLLFVCLQVTVFCAAGVLVIGLRGGEWVWGLFLAVPLMTLMFSYLWSIQALLGLLTRSTITSLLLTLLAWGGLFGLHTAETTLLFLKTGREVERADVDRQIAVFTADIDRLTTRPASTQPKTIESIRLANSTKTLENLQARREVITGSGFDRWHSLLYAAKWPLPKTAETTALLERVVQRQIRDRNRRDRDDDLDPDSETPNRVRGFMENERLTREAALASAREIQSRSPAWVLGTSLAFQLVILTLAAWHFHRRDF